MSSGPIRLEFARQALRNLETITISKLWPPTSRSEISLLRRHLVEQILGKVNRQRANDSDLTSFHDFDKAFDDYLVLPSLLELTDPPYIPSDMDFESHPSLEPTNLEPSYFDLLMSSPDEHLSQLVAPTAIDFSSVSSQSIDLVSALTNTPTTAIITPTSLTSAPQEWATVDEPSTETMSLTSYQILDALSGQVPIQPLVQFPKTQLPDMSSSFSAVAVSQPDCSTFEHVTTVLDLEPSAKPATLPVSQVALEQQLCYATTGLTIAAAADFTSGSSNIESPTKLEETRDSFDSFKHQTNHMTKGNDDTEMTEAIPDAALNSTLNTDATDALQMNQSASLTVIRRSARLQERSKMCTLSSRDVQTSTRIRYAIADMRSSKDNIPRIKLILRDKTREKTKTAIKNTMNTKPRQGSKRMTAAVEAPFPWQAKRRRCIGPTIMTDRSHTVTTSVTTSEGMSVATSVPDTTTMPPNTATVNAAVVDDTEDSSEESSPELEPVSPQTPPPHLSSMLDDEADEKRPSSVDETEWRDAGRL
ncbi:hypothetical protein BGZ94_002902 [Podila epigama]|nr:hypothetical protein BGZ94_002902 [Podila epigama]